MKKKYWAVLVLLALVALDWYIRAPDSRSRQLTSVIEAQASAKQKSYPYKFRVMKVSEGTAIMSTPRNREVPALKMLGALFPEIDTSNPNDPAFMAAEKLLADVQSEARAIVLAQPGIESVRWELDRKWLADHNIDVPDK